MNLEKYINLLVEYVGVEEDKIALVTGINGYNLEALESILYYYTALNDFDQLIQGLQADGIEIDF